MSLLQSGHRAFNKHILFLYKYCVANPAEFLFKPLEPNLHPNLTGALVSNTLLHVGPIVKLLHKQPNPLPQFFYGVQPHLP